MLEAAGVGAVIMLAIILWVLRKVAAAFIHIVVLLVAAVLLLVAIFGRSLGVYDVFLGTSYAQSDAPAHRLRPTDSRSSRWRDTVKAIQVLKSFIARIPRGNFANLTSLSAGASLWDDFIRTTDPC